VGHERVGREGHPPVPGLLRLGSDGLACGQTECC